LRSFIGFGRCALPGFAPKTLQLRETSWQPPSENSSEFGRRYISIQRPQQPLEHPRQGSFTRQSDLQRYELNFGRGFYWGQRISLREFLQPDRQGSVLGIVRLPREIFGRRAEVARYLV